MSPTPIRLAINGFGRIGRLTMRALLARPDSPLQVVAINDLGSCPPAPFVKIRFCAWAGDFDATLDGDHMQVGQHRPLLLSEQ